MKENQKRLNKVFVLGFATTEKVKEVLRQALYFQWYVQAAFQTEQVSEHISANCKRIPRWSWKLQTSQSDFCAWKMPMYYTEEQLFFDEHTDKPMQRERGLACYFVLDTHEQQIKHYWVNGVNKGTDMSDQSDVGFSKGSSQSYLRLQKKVMLSWDKKKCLLCLKSKTAQKTRKSITKNEGCFQSTGS